MQLQDFLDKLHQDGSLYVYPRSAEEAEGTCCAIILAGEEKEKLLAVAGERPIHLQAKKWTESSFAA